MGWVRVIGGFLAWGVVILFGQWILQQANASQRTPKRIDVRLVVVDPQTGCEYFESAYGVLTARLATDGVPKGCLEIETLKAQPE